MSKLGEVVFCVDCDRSVERYRSAVGDEAGRAPPPPRRMAVKKDANGDRLCAPCLDSRRANRNAAFLLHEGRAPIPGQGSTALQRETGAEAPARPRILRIASAVRIPRPVVSAEAASAAPIVQSRTRRSSSRGAAPALRGGAASDPPAIVGRQPARAKGQMVSKRGTKSDRVAEGRAHERAFVQLVVEVGFARTRALLAQLKHNLRSVR